MIKVSIQLERESGIYYAGEVIRGTAKFSSPKVLACRALNVELRAKAKVHWHRGSGSKREDYDGSTIYQNQRYTIKGNFFRTGVLEKSGEHANFDSIRDLGLIHIPCTTDEKTSSNFQLIIRIMDYDWGKKDNLIGESLLDIPSLVEAGTQKTYHLTKFGRPEKGEITMSAKFVPYNALHPQPTQMGNANGAKHEHCLVLQVHQATRLRNLDSDLYVQVYRPDENSEEDITYGKKLPGPRDDGLTLDGEIVAPFAFPLQQDVVPSAEIGAGDRSHIRYVVRASIDLAGAGVDPFAKQLLTIVPSRPIPKSMLISPHIVKIGPEALASCNCTRRNHGAVTINLALDRLSFAPGELIDMSKSLALYEGKSDEVRAEIELEGHFQLSTFETTETVARIFPIGELELKPGIVTPIQGKFGMPHVYPSFWGGVKGKKRSNYACIRWTYLLRLRVVRQGGCEDEVEASLPILISSAPPYTKSLRLHKDLQPNVPTIMSVWEVFKEAAIGCEEACITAPTLTGPGDFGRTVNMGEPVRTWEGLEDINNVGEGGVTYQPIVTIFDGPSIFPLDGGSAGVSRSSIEGLLEDLDKNLDKRLVVRTWTRSFPSQTHQLSAQNFSAILKKVPFALDQPSVVGVLMAAFEGSPNLTCEHIVSAMNVCEYQKMEVASIMAPLVNDPQKKDTVLRELENSYDKRIVSQKFMWA